MKKFKKILTSPIVTVASFALAAGLLLFSSVGGARAALTFFSETYTSDIEMSEIGVGLVENGSITEGKLLANMLGEGEQLKLGKRYTEQLSVRNTGSIGQYVRVNVYKYWKEPMKEDGSQGDKTQELSPELIRLLLQGNVLGTEGGSAALAQAGWLFDEKASTEERMVLYYNRPLAAADAEAGTPAGESSLFADQISIDGSVAAKIKQDIVQDEKGTTITTVYVYNGYEFCLDVKVDAVQDHNAADAILSAWGRSVTIDGNGYLSLN